MLWEENSQKRLILTQNFNFEDEINYLNIVMVVIKNSLERVKLIIF